MLRTGKAIKSFAAAIMCLAVLMLGATGAQTEAASQPAREYLIKAAFLYNFAKFTQWPAGSFADGSTPLSICVLGEDPFDSALDSLNGREIRGHPVTIQRVATVEAGATCHLLFISGSEEAGLSTILDSVADRPVLTIADFPNFARDGGIINLKTNKDQKVRFEINVGIAKRAGLKLSSKLLNLAEIISN